MKPYFFIQLFFIVIFMAIIMPMLGDSAVNKRFIAHFQGELNRYWGATTMALLVESMAPQSATQRASYVVQQQRLLPFNIALQDIDTLELDAQQLLDLHQKKLVYNADNNFLYMILARHTQVLVIEDVNTNSDLMLSEAEREGMGLMALLQRQLQRTESQQWHALVTRKAQLFSFDVALQSVADFPLNQQQQAKLQQGRLVAITTDKLTRYGSGLDYLLQLTPNRAQVLVAGPISPPIYSWIRGSQLLNILLLALIFISLRCCWMCPTWRSSRELLVFIEQHAELGTADKLKLHFGSNFNALHSTFNQMSENINRLFSHNQTAIQYLTRRLSQPLQDMQREFAHVSDNPKLLISAEQLKTFDNSIDKIRRLSSEILLFSNVQRINSLPDMCCVNLEKWLHAQQRELQLAAPQLNVVMLRAQGDVQLDSKLLLKALKQILTAITVVGVDKLCMQINVKDRSAVLLLSCSPATKALEQELRILCTAANNPPQKLERQAANTAQYLPWLCSAKILQLQHCTLQLRQLQGDALALEIIFPLYDKTMEEGA